MTYKELGEEVHTIEVVCDLIICQRTAKNQIGHGDPVYRTTVTVFQQAKKEEPFDSSLQDDR